MTAAAREPWTRRESVALAATVLVGIAIRVVLLPTQGLRGDLDQFVGWAHHIATNGLGTLYGDTSAGPVTFGPVMGYILAILTAIDPAFRTATSAADDGIRILMKVPASAADIGLALLIAYALRARPRWAVGGAALILLHPAVIDVSAWWGQYEPIYLLTAVAAAILAIQGRNGWAAAALAISLLTKPQVVPLLIPFAAWFWATGGWRGLLRASAVGAAVIVIVWLPYIPAGGPAGYLRNLGEYQGDIFNFLSLRAWNAWWLVQEAVAGGGFIKDDPAVLGPLTLRQIGYAIAVLLDLGIAAVIIRDPRPRTLILGLTSAVLVFFAFATQMHERYAYGALVFLALLVAEPRARWLGLAFGVVFTLNLLAAVPPTPEIGALLPVSGLLGVTGSIAMLAITYGGLRLLATTPTDLDAAPAPP
jgi:Gpi18-like mannosyltransferase